MEAQLPEAKKKFSQIEFFLKFFFGLFGPKSAQILILGQICGGGVQCTERGGQATKKNPKNLKSKKKKLNHKKKFFFALKSFLNDFKVILRKKKIFRFFPMGKICL